MIDINATETLQVVSWSVVPPLPDAAPSFHSELLTLFSTSRRCHSPVCCSPEPIQSSHNSRLGPRLTPNSTSPPHVQPSVQHVQLSSRLSNMSSCPAVCPACPAVQTSVQHVHLSRHLSSVSSCPDVCPACPACPAVQRVQLSSRLSSVSSCPAVCPACPACPAVRPTCPAVQPSVQRVQLSPDVSRRSDWSVSGPMLQSFRRRLYKSAAWFSKIIRQSLRSVCKYGSKIAYQK